MTMRAPRLPSSRRATTATALLACLPLSVISTHAVAQVGPPAPRARAAAPLLALPAADPDANKTWRYNIASELQLAATDNALVTETGRESDLITTGLISAAVTADSRRTSLNANVDVSYDYYAKHPDLSGPRAQALAAATVELWQDSLWVDGRAATNLREVSQSGQSPATERALGANQTQVLTYGVSPTIRQDLNRAITFGATYNLSGVKFLDTFTANAPVAAGDTTTHQVDAFLSSFSEADRLNWRLSASHESTNTSGGPPTADRQSAQLSTQYRVLSQLFFVAAGGYDRIIEPTLTQNIEEPFANAGLTWIPGPRLRVSATAGKRFGGLDFNGNLFYALSDRISLTGSVGRSIETPQRVLSGALGGLTRDEAGNLVDPVTGLSSDPTTSPFDLLNQAFRRDVAQVSLNGRTTRSFYRLSALAERRDANGARSESWSGQATVGRELSRRLTGSVTAAYTRVSGSQTLGAPSSESETTKIVSGLDYNLGRTVTASLSHNYLHRVSTFLKYSENVALLSFRKRW